MKMSAILSVLGILSVSNSFAYSQCSILAATTLPAIDSTMGPINTGESFGVMELKEGTNGMMTLSFYDGDLTTSVSYFGKGVFQKSSKKLGGPIGTIFCY